MHPLVNPIGVFDSGVGGLSVLQALRQELPQGHFIYLADSGHAPYGERGDDFVRQRTLAVASWLRARHRISALVVACNTATAAALEPLRAALPELPAIGVEPALKPAALGSRTGHVGVLATRGTVESARFERLRRAQPPGTRFAVQACDGLARAIEQSAAGPLPAATSAAEIEALCARYTGAMGRFGLQAGEIDTLVLGCTHYVFARDVLRALVGPQVRLIDTGAAVARQTRRVLAQAGALPSGEAPGLVTLCATGQPATLQAAARRWLGLPAQQMAQRVEIPSL